MLTFVSQPTSEDMLSIEQKYAILKARHEFNENDVAEWFGYKNTQSLRSSSSRLRTIQGIVRFYESLFGEIR